MKKIILVTGLFIFSFFAGFAQLHDTLVTIDFSNGADSIVQYYHLSGTQWQRGAPQKTVLDSAYNAPNAIITDTINPYLPGTYTYFEVPFIPSGYGNFGNNDFVCPLMICFHHKTDWDPNSAGGWLSIRDNDDYISPLVSSGDMNINGNTYFYWMADVQDNATTPIDTLFNDTLGFTSLTTDWRQTCINLFYLTLGSRSFDTLYYRFSFQSDSTLNASHGGWLIDDIHIGQGVGYCNASTEENDNSDLMIYPNPCKDVVYVNHMIEFKEGSYELYDLHGKVLQKNSLSNEQPISIPLNHVLPGVYWIKMEIDHQSYIKKILVSP